MKIVQIITRSDNIGGAQMHVFDLSKSLMKMGHEVTVIVGGEGPFCELLQEHGIAYRSISHLVRSIRPAADGRAFIEIRRVLKQIQPDLIATHSSKAGWIGRMVGKTLGIPTVFTAHGWSFAEGVPSKQRRIYVIAEKLAAYLATRIVTVSEHDRTLALKHKVSSAKQLVAIHNGIPDIPNLLANPKQNPPHMIMVARFEQQKDHRTLLEALSLVKDLNWKLDLVGEGPLKTEMVKLAQELKLDHQVRFLGECKDVPRMLTQAQIFLLISNWEGLPISILEAMRAGLPVVASDVGGVCETVEDQSNGFLIPRGNVNVLAERIRELIESPELRIRFGAEGRLKFENQFTSKHMNDKILSLYEAITSKSGMRG
ncbi:glycosyltransferase family 4 protein [Paenibacillus sp. N1-5-1-14]|uniref:glycosyltransferase family 4 protein n=1 Tax=Paenibacillus radicibacter TaxID=2972488 RepID=UPI0021595F26|nr:glycosyltransferase family 4 protein [Paenibacillus radicibacter]MCR8641080.1 glycosyltransferase family 4 protein [Paenibacillus radicibacter]